MTRGPTNTWFDTLRRDRRLFVLLASFIILVQAMQPLALAGQTTGGGHFVICTDGDVDPLQPQLHVDCSKCIAAACRVMPVTTPDVAGSDTIVYAAPEALEIQWPANTMFRPIYRPATSLPPARAPPFIA